MKGLKAITIFSMLMFLLIFIIASILIFNIAKAQNETSNNTNESQIDNITVKNVTQEKVTYIPSSETYTIHLDEDNTEIGDMKEKDFKPHLKLNRWGGEAFLSVWLDDSKIQKKDKSVKLEGNKIKWSSPKIGTHFYKLNKTETKDGFIQNELGGIEFETILYNKPDSNVLTFSINSNNLKFYYQPPLDEEVNCSLERCKYCNATHCWDEDKVITIYRPENVVGSYAVYHSSKTDNKYKAGKAFHIYRPKVIDANGDWIWADLNINEFGILRVSIPKEFLDKAVYPVTVDPTFGYETVGGSSWTIENWIRGSTHSPSSSGTAKNITMYLVAGSVNVKCAMYSGDGNTKDLVNATEERYGLGTGWQTFSMNDTSILYYNDYTLVAWGNGGSVKYDSGETNQMVYDSETYNGWPDPNYFTLADYVVSIYCVYEQAPGDWEAPKYDPDTLDTNTTEFGQPCKFYSNWTDNEGLSGFILEHNNTGTLTDENWTSFESLGSGNTWSNYTLTLNDTEGVIKWRFKANDTSNNWNNSMPYQYIENLPPTFSELYHAGNTNEEPFEKYTNPRFYRNGTWQKEDWIYISTKITDISGVDTVLCEWKNQTQWYNYTMNKAGTDTYYLNITDQPSYGGYTFNIWANDTHGNMGKIYNWTFYDYESGWGVKENWRKYVGLNGTPVELSYEQFYLYAFSYGSDMTQDRCMPHEQPTNGSQDDSGLMYYDQPTSDQERECSSWVGFYIDETFTINDSTPINDTYLHVWWATDDDKITLAYKTVKADAMREYTDESYSTNKTKSVANVSGLSGFQHSTYFLEAKFWNISNDPAYNDNNISLFCFKGLRDAQHPSIISTSNYSSFIILNLPDNTTLQSLDSDSDGLNDHEELYTYYTDPKDSDTDGGGENDQSEVSAGKDPLDPSDDDTTPPTYSKNITNTTVAGYLCEFRLEANDNIALHNNGGYIFSTNNTGTWANASFVSFIATPQNMTNVTTLNSTVGTIVGWCYYFNDSIGYWNSTSCEEGKQFTLTTTDIAPQYSDNSTNSTIAGKPTKFRLKWTDNIELSGFILSIDNCTQEFWNASWKSMTGATNWTNYSSTSSAYIINSTVGCTVKWKVYANDTSDNWSVSENFSFVTTSDVEYSRNVTEAMTFTESLTKTSGFGRIPIQSFILAVYTSRIGSLFKELVQYFTITDAVSRGLLFIQSVSQSFDVNTITIRIGIFSRILSESITANVFVSRMQELIRSVTQSIITSLTVTGEKVGFNTRFIGLTLTITDTSSRLLNLYRSLSESLSLTTITSRFFIIIRSPITGFTISDITSRLTSFSRALTQGIPISGIILRTQFLIRMLSQQISITQIATGQIPAVLNQRFTSLAITLSDSVTRVRTFMRTVSQALNVNVVFSRILSLIRTISETISIIPRIILRPCSILPTEDSCTTYGCYWCSGVCQSDSCPVPTPPPPGPGGGGWIPPAPPEVKPAVLDTDIRMETEQVLPGDKVYAIIRILKVEGPEETINVNLTYWIRDPFERVLGSKSTVVGVDILRENLYFLMIPVGSTLGTYTFECLAQYNNASDTSSANFEVVSKLPPSLISIREISVPVAFVGGKTTVKIFVENLVEDSVDVKVTVFLPEDFEPSNITVNKTLEPLSEGSFEFEFTSNVSGSFTGFIKIEYNGKKVIRDFSIEVAPPETLLIKIITDYLWLIVTVIIIIIFKTHRRKRKKLKRKS